MSQRFYILMPSPDRRSVLAVGTGRRARLPSVDGKGRRLADILAALARSRDIRAPFLRMAGRADADGRTSYLCELDAPATSWEPRAPGYWLALRDVDPARLAPGLTEGITSWLEEQHGAPIPPQRAPWARPGWLDEVHAWASQRFAVRSGPHLVRQWPLSSVQRIETDEGPLYLKAAFALFHHEPVVTDALCQRHPGLVPEIVAVERKRGWLLMRELPEAQVADHRFASWLETVRTLAGIQQDWTDRGAQLAALGAPDRSVERLRLELPHLAERYPTVSRALPRLERLCDALAATELDQTLVHGDFHPGNAVSGANGIVIFDWSDACLAPACFDLATFLRWTRSAKRRDGLVAAYADCWETSDIRRLWSLAAPLAHLHHAVSYLQIGAALEPADRGLFPYEPRRWVRAALKLLS
jgi:hypothetical protein